MGLAPGIVTGVPGIPRTRQLKIIGNGVVPQQAAVALRLLISAAAIPAVPAMRHSGSRMNRPCPRDSAPVRAHVTVRLRILGNGVAPRQGAAAAL